MNQNNTTGTIDNQENSPAEPLYEEGGLCDGEEDFIYDEDGSSILRETPRSVRSVRRLRPLRRPCSLRTLNGSWLLTIAPSRPQLLQQIRGPMRLEVDSPRVRISGDIYVRKMPLVIRGRGMPHLASPDLDGPFVPGSLVIKRNWYPAFPQKEYRWYFRSTGVKYSKGTLRFKFERHIWSSATQSFVSKDNGWMEFECEMSLIRPIGAPRPTIEMRGSAMIGGISYGVTATKTSAYCRGCLVEVDVMTNRRWPDHATSCDQGQAFTFSGVYRAAGMDFRAIVNEVDIPGDPLLSIAELHTLLSTHRSLSAGGDNWHLWLLVGSRMDGTLGIMFDTGNAPHREGAVGFYDPTLPNIDIIHAPARDKKLGEVPLGFLRTLIHEAGHAFNLFHPKHDVHGVATGTTIMNQTGDVMGFATAADPYPCNATMAFNNHNRTSLLHSPDPQVKPGWKEFGWGHGSAWSGVAEPVDASGLDDGDPPADDLLLEIQIPDEAVRGEFVNAVLTVTNRGEVPHDVTTALNLAEGDLRLTVTTPAGQVIDARDVVVACGIRRMKTLQPGEKISGSVQIFYGPHGFTFDQPGHYEVGAELSVGDGTVIRSNPASLVIRPAVTTDERELEGIMMDKDVGLSLALGDFCGDNAVQDKLVAVMDRFGNTETGAASAMVLANTLSRDLRDVRSGRVVVPRDEGAAKRALESAFNGRDAATVARLTTAVVSSRETNAPLLDIVERRVKSARKGSYSDEDKALALKMFSDHLA